MGSRDHSVTCDVCGEQRGGMNDVPCACDQWRAETTESPADAHHLAEIRRLDAECARLRAERDEARARILRPLTEGEVVAALHEGRAERMVAEGDNAWTTLVKQRDDLRARLAVIEGERDALKADIERARRHPMAPERCPVCEWTNTNLMNYGSAGRSKWMCHDCAARTIEGALAKETK